MGQVNIKIFDKSWNIIIIVELAYDIRYKDTVRRVLYTDTSSLFYLAIKAFEIPSFFFLAKYKDKDRKDCIFIEAIA